MTTAYTSLLGLALPVTGELSGTWGDTVNNAITSLLDTAVAGTTTLSTDGDVTLTTTTGASNQARQAILLCSGARTAARNITAPAQSKIYTVINATTGGYAVVIRGAGPTTGVTVPAGKAIQVAWNGSDFVELSPNSITGNLTVGGNLAVTGTSTLTGDTYIGATTAGGMGAQTGLTVVGGATVGTNTPGALTLGSHYNTRTTGDVVGKLDFYSNDASSGASGVQASIRGLTETATGDASGLYFYTGTSAALTLRALLSNTGSFYLNNTNPSSGGVYFSTNTSSPTEYFDINTNDDFGQFTTALSGTPWFRLNRSRGTLAAKTAVASGDISTIQFTGYDGAAYQVSSSIQHVVDNTVSSGVVPGKLKFTTATASGVDTAAMFIDSAQGVTIGTASVSGYPLYITKNSNNSADAMIYLYPSTNTNSSHIIMNNGGSGAFVAGRANSAGTIQTFGTGTAYASAVYTSGTTPLYFATNNTHAMNINTSQYVAVSTAGTSAPVPLSVSTPASGAGTYMVEINPASSNNSASMMMNNSGAGSYYVGRASTGGLAAGLTTFNASEPFLMNTGTQKLVIGTNSLRALLVDSNGYVTTPYQPSFCVYQSSNLSGAQSPVKFDTVRHNIGGGYSTSTGRFTAPVDGVYFLSVTNNVIQANGVDGLIRKNGSNIIGVEYDAATAGVWLGLTATTVLSLAAGDYIDYIMGAGGSTTVEGTPWNNFVGFLIG